MQRKNILREGSGLADVAGLLSVATITAASETDAPALFAERAAALEQAGSTDLRTSMSPSLLSAACIGAN